LEVCNCLLNQYHEGDTFWSHIFIHDETWVHYWKPENESQLVEWRCLISTVKKKFKTQPVVGEGMFTMFGDSHGPVLEHYQERDVVINSECYSEKLCDKLKLAFWNKCRGQLSKLLCCCMTVPVPILLKHSSSCALRSENSPYILINWIFNCSETSEML
jgi:hypothetical protein